MKFPAMWSISDEQPYQRYICMHHIIILHSSKILDLNEVLWNVYMYIPY